jgi:hypothetical protein
MSIHEKPVANRLIDLQDKHTSYRKHVSAVSCSRATINTSQADVPPRLQVAAVSNHRHRRGLVRGYVDHDRMMRSATRPETVAGWRGAIPRAREPEISEYETAYRRQGSRLASRVLPRQELVPRKQISVRIGFSDQPIVAED